MRSPALFCDEVADGSPCLDGWAGARSFRGASGSDEPFCDEPVERAGTTQRNKTSDGTAVVGDRDFATVTDQVEVTAEVISEFSNACFHGDQYGAFTTEVLAILHKSIRTPASPTRPRRVTQNNGAEQRRRTLPLPRSSRRADRRVWRVY